MGLLRIISRATLDKAIKKTDFSSVSFHFFWFFRKNCLRKSKMRVTKIFSRHTRERSISIIYVQTPTAIIIEPYFSVANKTNFELVVSSQANTLKSEPNGLIFPKSCRGICSCHNFPSTKETSLWQNITNYITIVNHGRHEGCSTRTRP